ncbi:MAG: hypothetical protein R2745_11945 [Vicinamibacterales bacterium]
MPLRRGGEGEKMATTELGGMVRRSAGGSREANQMNPTLCRLPRPVGILSADARTCTRPAVASNGFAPLAAPAI